MYYYENALLEVIQPKCGRICHVKMFPITYLAELYYTCKISRQSRISFLMVKFFGISKPNITTYLQVSLPLIKF